MRIFNLFLLSFALVQAVSASDVTNYPNGNYMIVDGHIISMTESGNGSQLGFGFGLSVPTFSEASQVDEYIRSHVSSANLTFNGYKGAQEVRNGQSDIVGGYVILVSQNYSDEDYDDILNAVRQCGYSVSDYPDFIYYDLGAAQIVEVNSETSDNSQILECLNYIADMLNWCFFTLCILWGSVLYIAFMQKR